MPLVATMTLCMDIAGHLGNKLFLFLFCPRKCPDAEGPERGWLVR